jgi:N-acetylmuramoyl-L-alanine amidase
LEFVTLRAVIVAVALGAASSGAVLTISAVRAADDVDLRALAAPATSFDFPTAQDVHLGGDDKQTRFVMDFDRKVDLTAFTLADPYRVVIDLPQVAFQLPKNAGDQGRGLIKSFRYGLIMQGGSRIVLDAKAPVKIEEAFTLAAENGQPAKLVLDFSPTDRDSFLRTIALENRKPREAKRVQAVKPDTDPRPLIVLDPGHGGIDTGTHGPGGELEKDVVLVFAKMLREKLEAGGKYRVVMTRDDDTFIPLNERIRFARSRGASLFVSLHADALPKREGQADGATVYTLSEKASDAEAARMAENENRADVIAGVDLTSEPDDVANILVDLAQRETKTFSLQFAKAAVNELKRSTRLHKKPLKSAGFVVLRAPDVPSVLVELGYMSDKEDLSHLTSANWRSRNAESLSQAIDDFFAPRLVAGAGIR